jgi:hypothetical protein
LRKKKPSLNGTASNDCLLYKKAYFLAESAIFFVVSIIFLEESIDILEESADILEESADILAESFEASVPALLLQAANAPIARTNKSFFML